MIGFLAAILVLAHLCDEDGLFRACGGWMARTSAGSPRRLPAQVFAAAVATTAALIGVEYAVFGRFFAADLSTADPRQMARPVRYMSGSVREPGGLRCLVAGQSAAAGLSGPRSPTN